MFININNSELINILQIEAIRKSVMYTKDLIIEYKEGSKRISFNSVDFRDNAFDKIKDKIESIELKQVIIKD